MGCCEKPAIARYVRVLEAASTLVAIVLSILAIRSCEFLMFTAGEGGGIYNRHGAIGLWSYTNDAQWNQNCVEYPDEVVENDAFLRTARIVSAFGPFGGFGGLVLLSVELICVKVCCSRCFGWLCYLFAMACTIIMYLLNWSEFCTNDNSECEWAQGSTFCLVSLILYLISVLLQCFTPRPDPLLVAWQDDDGKREQEQPKQEQSADAAKSSGVEWDERE